MIPTQDSPRKAVWLWQNADGTWTARIFGQTFTGTHAECWEWLLANGEQGTSP